MDLRTVKEIAALRAQLGPLQRQAAERMSEAMKRARIAAIAEFKAHFVKAGFVVSGESRRYLAAYEGMQFVLEIIDTPDLDSAFRLALKPPVVLGEPGIDVHLVRERDAVAEVHVDPAGISIADAARNEANQARALLLQPDPVFRYVVREGAGEKQVGTDYAHASAEFDTFADVLEDRYASESSVTSMRRQAFNAI